MSLLSLFDLSLLGRADRAALDYVRADGNVVTFTFRDLEERSNRLAHTLQRRGLNRGDRLAFFLTNRVEVIDLWIAAVKLSWECTSPTMDFSNGRKPAI